MIFPIHHTFGPLADKRQVILALSLLIRPWRWRNGPSCARLSEELHRRFSGEVFLYGSGREALVSALQALKFQPGEEVIVQGFTCVVVPNAIHAAGMVPVFADIDPQTLNLDLEEVERAITPKTRAVICQHTFGIPAHVRRLRNLCDRNGLVLIEDCAHMIPDQTGPADVGHLGDITFFSFGRDKAISGVTGGALVSRRKDLTAEFTRIRNNRKPLPLLTIKALLLYPVIYALARPFYALWIGKAFLALCAKLHLLVPILTRAEKQGTMPEDVHALPDACAALALEQYERLSALNAHRRALTRLYFDEGTKRGWPLLLGVTPDLPLQKFPFFVPGAEKIRRALKRHNIHLHDGWTGCVICPMHADQNATGYRDGQDPDAEMAGKQIISLPTHPTMSLKQARKLIELLDPLLP